MEGAVEVTQHCFCDECYQMYSQYEVDADKYDNDVSYPVAPDASELPPPPAEWVDVYYKQRSSINLSKMLRAIEGKTDKHDDELNSYKTWVCDVMGGCNPKVPAGFRRWRDYAIHHLRKIIDNEGKA